ncbi:hypothetical protein [Pseudomonas sp. NPDC086251]|uniref:hypothetical protein n=1 Tax=Pseudomonas sp. NPDC086251 TaxID=3364431 RepID=UPI003838BF01
MTSQLRNSRIGDELAQSNGFNTYSDCKKGQELNLTPEQLSIKKEQWAKEEKTKREELAKKEADRNAVEANAENTKKLVDSVESTCFGAIYDRLKDPKSADFETAATVPDLKKRSMDCSAVRHFQKLV